MAKTSSPFLRGGNLRISLGTTLNGLLALVPPEERKAMKRGVKEEGWQRGVRYEDDDGKPQPTPILLRPRILGGNQRAYLHEVSRVMERAHAKLYHLWHEHSSVKRLLPLTPREERWLADLGPPGRADDVFFGRFDCSTDFGSPDWVKSTQFFEYNPIGAGGLYVAPTVDDIVMKHVVPALRRQAPTLLLEPNDDPRRVLLEVLADHARALRLKRFNIALCQYKDLPGGIDEFPFHEKFFQAMGINAWHVDPRELRWKGDEMFYGDHPIDIIYRDHEISDLAAKEEAGEDVSAIKRALKEGRVVSSLAGEFDHKSAFQVFSAPEFETWFTAAERAVFHKHVPWTRIIEQTKTTGPDGKEVDLLPWLGSHREEIVLKPNRAYGGEGILMGRECTDLSWANALAKAEHVPGTFVAQGYRPVAEKDFPIIDEEGNLGHAEYFTVLGLYSSEQRLAILGRASQKKVVNLAQKGGVVAVLRLL